MSKDRIGVICSTYRNPEKPSLTRLYGIVSLIDQIKNQSLDADTRIVIVDDSPEKHPFVEGLGNSMDSSLLYFHVPSRNDVGASLPKKFQDAARFMPKDEDFSHDPFWKTQLQKVSAWESFLPFDYEFAKTFQINMAAQMVAPRPTIGMKKNFGCGAYVESEGSVPDIFVYVDDDDLRSPDYLRIVRDGIQGHDFARVTKTYCHNISPEPQHRVWGEIDFGLEKDINNNWVIPAYVMEKSAYKYENGILTERPVYDLYPRNLMLAWPIISHDGALHNYTGNAWKRAVDEFGGFLPTSFSEDIITHKMMSALSGFKSAVINVDAPPFIRCSDGRNASDFYCTRIIDKTEPDTWTRDALEPLYTAVALDAPYAEHEKILKTLGCIYAQTGKIDIAAIRPQP